ncbi:Protein of unknown function [Neorhodopirellula lusitana]|uniref:Secreted protein containing DUF1549 n=1 Tax=Neorhodopirellula lusitana TaxID=445327 RepID=A0ABY1QAU9_9BACT|nr:DUF1549 and DUF1553 domain-containing protein [Neorhodopirellula lusitana]SMP61343.1 Protein of unknown function [Neorhodopirellula lusitana]
MQVVSLRSVLRLFLPSLTVGLAISLASVSSSGLAEPAPASSTSQDRSVHRTEPPTESLAERFANADTTEVPDFQKHVMPLLGRLGCNGRSCHGSFQGRGGFQLSLFGYDFKADHAALLAENAGRVDVDDVDESLILAKPIDEEMHEGGKRFERDSWHYHTLRRWIETGAKKSAAGALVLNKLKITPGELQFHSADQEVQLQAVAYWEDGSVEDVTALCRFATNDDAVAAVNEDGVVKSGLSGDTHVVVSYDRAVVPVAITRPVDVDAAEMREAIANVPASDHPVDRLIAVKHQKLGVVPSTRCTDADFIRRVSFDMTGTLPAAEDVKLFLADKSPDKRTRLIDELLEAPGYAAWWATRMADWTGNSDQQLNNALPVQGAASKLWYEWLRVRLDDNVPYDEIVEGMVQAESRQDGESYVEFCAAMTEACQNGNEDQFAARDGMPLYWVRRNFQKPEERAIGIAYAFLGVRIECAQCHKHPFDQWSKDDFEKFSKLFTNIQARANTISPRDREAREQLLTSIVGEDVDLKKINGGELRRTVYQAAKSGKVVPFGELLYSARNKNRQRKNKKNAQQTVGPVGHLLGDANPISLATDPRSQLMDWLRSPENPYFAKAIVNRVWANYFGIGIINPTDDMNLANPPSNAELLDYLSVQFIEHDFDLHWLHRTITTSDAYQRSTEANASNQHDRKNFSRHLPRRLPAEVIRDAVILATQSTKTEQRMRNELDEMAIAASIKQGRNNRDFALQVFGQSERENNCDCDRSDSPSLLQSIYLRNDLDVYKQLDSKQGWVTQACEQLGENGPQSQASPNRDQITRKAEGVQKQLIARVKRLQQMPENRREKAIVKLKQSYSGVRKRFATYGFETPPMQKLLRNPDAWELTPTKKQSDMQSASLATIVDDAYLRTLSRFPLPDEKQTAMDYVQESESTANGLGSLMWALVNTKEFIITH